MSPEQSNDTEPNPETTDTKAGAANGGLSLQNRSFNVISTECGSGTNESSASFEASRIRVSGTITGSDSCYTAKLKRAVCNKDVLTVSVQSYKRKSETPCSMCVTDIDYEAVFDFKTELPQTIVVLHDDTEVLNESRT